MSADEFPCVDDSQAIGRAEQMRQAFDRTFAEPRPPEPPPSEEMLAIRIAGEAYALRLSEIAGLFADRKITPLPTAVAALLGLAGFRGAVVPVYDLHLLLGYPAAETVRWLATVAEAPIAVAFAQHEGQFRLSHDSVVPQTGGSARRHVREFATVAGLRRPIVDLSSVVAAVRRQLPSQLDTQER